MIHFRLSGQPRAWKRVRTRGGQFFTDPKTRAHQREIAGACARAWGERPPMFVPVKLFVAATFEIPASWPKRLREAAMTGSIWHDSDPDYDNLLKEVADAIKFIAYVDDCQIADGHCVKRYGTGARTDVWLAPMGGPLDTPAAARRHRKWHAGGYDAAIARTAAHGLVVPRTLYAGVRGG